MNQNLVRMVDVNHQYWYLEKFNLLKMMKEADIESVEQNMLPRVLKKGSVLHFPEMMHKYVYFLKEGMIKVCRTGENDKEMIRQLIKPGTLFGELSLIQDAESGDDYAVALKDSSICFIDTLKLKEWMAKNRELSVEVNKHIANRITRIENRLAAMFFKNASQRIETFLAEFARDYGRKTDTGYEVDKVLTDEEIGRLTANSRQTVSRVLNELRDNKEIDYDSQQIKIPFTSGIMKALSSNHN